MFGSDIAIELVHSEDVQNGRAFARGADIFILPGILGQRSYYPDHIGPRGNAHIRTFVQRGGLFLGFCAGAYYAAQHIVYEPEWGERRERLSGTLSFFNGTAFGPVPGYGRTTNDAPRDELEEIGHVDPVPVLVCDKRMEGRRIELAYGLGPLFRTAADPRIDVIARYADVEGMPPAVMDIPFGRGRVILSGVLPQFGHESDPALISSRVGAPLTHLLERLYAFRDERRAFWNILMERVAEHHGRQLPAYAP